MSDNSYIFEELSLEYIQGDLTQPRDELGVDGDENRLFVSMRDIGIQQPLVVKMIDTNLHTIIDGHRRYTCAKRLGIKTVPCFVYKKMGPGELERVRYEAQNNRRDWKPMEKAEAIAQTKTAGKFENDYEVAEYLHLAPSTVSSILKLRTQNMKYMRLMEKYELAEAYRVALGRLMPKVCKIKDLEPEEIILLLFEKIEKKVIKRALELRVLKRIFMRATANKEAIYRFLKDPKMTITELERITSQSATTLLIDKLFTDLSGQALRGEKIAPREKALYVELRDVLNHLTQE